MSHGSTGRGGTGHPATGSRAGAHGAKPPVHRTSTASHRTGGAADQAGGTAQRTGSATRAKAASAKTSAADQGATVTKLSVSRSTTDDGILTMSARVSPAHRTVGASAVTGSVVFTVDGASSGPIPLTGGRAMVQAEVGPGEHTVTAAYSGDDEHMPSDSEPVSVGAE